MKGKKCVSGGRDVEEKVKEMHAKRNHMSIIRHRYRTLPYPPFPTLHISAFCILSLFSPLTSHLSTQSKMPQTHPQPTSIFLARLLGPAAILFATTEYKNSNILPSPDPAVIYLNGSILFVAGLSIILSHNRMSRDWTVLITLLGWAILALGLGRMVEPRLQPEGDAWGVYATEGVLGVVGGLLCWRGYVA